MGIANIGYIASVGEFIETRASASGYECQFRRCQADELLSMLEESASASVIEENGTAETFEFTDEAILESLQEADNAEADHTSFQFEFDDGDEIQIRDDALDLAEELKGSQIQKAAAQVLIRSIRTNVSDIHIEPRESECKIRVRRDGVMQPYVQMPKSAGIRLTACLKNMAKMDIAERRASQDGKIFARYDGERMEFRCSTAPGKYGEKMVLRILNSSTEMLSLDLLMDDEAVRSQFRSLISEANGIIIVSGPTGSGKSTTLASALREKDNGECNIVTAEDPIEYDLGGDIQQFQVLPAKGQTFAKLLRTFLRQDPDVILIGETRDPETAESSMDAAETGHLVFTTLHANSTASSLTRLLDMKVPAYKLTASVRGILAQRLMRKVCPDCSVEHTVSTPEQRFSGIREGTVILRASVLSAEERMAAKDNQILCNLCNGTGYQGRVGTYELMLMSRGIRDAIKAEKSTQEIEDIAIAEGMLTLKSYAAKLVERRLTTISEMSKICNTES
jgi:type IV pilus assembly protein PilB